MPPGPFQKVITGCSVPGDRQSDRKERKKRAGSYTIREEPVLPIGRSYVNDLPLAKPPNGLPIQIEKKHFAPQRKERVRVWGFISFDKGLSITQPVNLSSQE